MPAGGGGTTQSSTRPPWALGQCDRCGFHFKLNSLHAEIYDERPNGLLVCSACLDKDHPQLQLGRLKINDPQSLLNPRPDLNRPGSVGLFGWLPIGNPSTYVQCSVGTITVTTD
ncbi:MAG: hypothetical protein WC829_04520 [Hyphomicrobium sp.]|jgi:hypothetical protein